MVWQSPSSHNQSQDNSNTGGLQQQQQGGQQQQQQGNGSGSGGGPIGAEYTLQGVMRFLQTEWHRHERDRNNWEIERAEMKARIAKLEGENRAEKRSHQVLLARISVLEKVLKRERTERVIAEGRDLQEPGSVDKDNSPKEIAKGALKVFDEVPAAFYRGEAGKPRSRVYLEKCLQEITYLLAPPSHPPPPQTQQHGDSMEHQYQGQQHQHSLEQALYQHQSLQQPSPSPNHQPPPPPTQNNDLSQSHAMRSHPVQSMRAQQHSPFQVESRLPGTQPQISVPSMSPRESAERIPASLNAYSSLRNEYPARKDTNPFSASAGITAPSPSSSTSVEDAWDFDEKISPSDADSITSSLTEELPDYTGLNHHKPSSAQSQRRKLASLRRRSSAQASGDTSGNFKVKFAMRGHLDVIRAIVFTGGGSPSEPEICTAGDDSVLKRWYIPGNYNTAGSDVDVTSHFTHRGHNGIVTSLASCPSNPPDSTGDGWVFSGGQDSTIKVWESGRVDPKATLVGHTDTVWTVCVLPPSSASPIDRVLLASGSADATVKLWTVTVPSRRRPSSASIRGPPQDDPFEHSLISSITRPDCTASPTCITPMTISGEAFIASYNDAAVIVYDTASGDELSSMASQETYDGTPATGVTCVVATTASLESGAEAGKEEEMLVAGATGTGVVITGHEDQYIRIYDANSGQCTYTMLAHPAAIASLALSPDGRELVSAGHDASLRFWSMEKRACTQEITTHRLMRGEGVCGVVWSSNGKWVVSAGGDGVVKVYCR